MIRQQNMKNERNRIYPVDEIYEQCGEQQVEGKVMLEQDSGPVLAKEAKQWQLFLVDEYTPCPDEIAKVNEDIHPQRKVLEKRRFLEKNQNKTEKGTDVKKKQHSEKYEYAWSWDHNKQNLFGGKHNQGRHILQIVRITWNVHVGEDEQNKHNQKCENLCIVGQF